MEIFRIGGSFAQSGFEVEPGGCGDDSRDLLKDVRFGILKTVDGDLKSLGFKASALQA